MIESTVVELILGMVGNLQCRVDGIFGSGHFGVASDGCSPILISGSIPSNQQSGMLNRM